MKAFGSWAAVFVVGFGIGYGLMALMVESPETSESSAMIVSTEEAPEDSEASADAPAEAVVEATADDPAAEGEAKPAGGGAPSAEADPAADAPAGEAPDVPAAAEPSAEPEPTPEPEPVTWWDRCRGQTCVMDWGGLTGGISVRKGSLTHRATVDWERDFAHTARRGVIPSGDDIRVQVLAVGLDHEGKPAAANVVWTTGGQRLQGVISLAPGDRRITLKPL